MEAKNFDLELEAEAYQVKDVLRAVLHTIIFHRNLAQVHPRDVTIDFLELTYVRLDGQDKTSLSKCHDPQLDREIDGHIQTFQTTLEASPPSQLIQLSFYQHREKKGWLSFKGPSDECWERWRITLRQHEAKTEQEQKQFLTILDRQLRACLIYIATNAFQFDSHVPQISGPDKVFPFKISVPNSSQETWGTMLRKMVSETTGPHLLG